MLAAAPTSLVHGESYQVIGPSGGAGTPVTLAQAQAFFDSLIPGQLRVTSLVVGQPNTTLVIDWLGATTPLNQTVLGSVPSLTITDFGPTPAPAAPAASNVGTYVAVGVGVLALGALAYAMSRSRTTGPVYARDNPLPRKSVVRFVSTMRSGTNRGRTVVGYGRNQERWFESYAAAMKFVDKLGGMAEARAALVV